MTGPDRTDPQSGREPAGQQASSPPDRGAPSPAATPAGSIRYQDPDSAVPREPSLAERRERDRLRREAEEAAWRQAQEDARDQQKRSRRRKQLIGGGVAVGLVGALALIYVSGTDDDPEYQNAQCVNDQQVVVDDSYCSGSQGSYGPGGMWLFFVGGNRYQYSYGSNAAIGQRATGSLTPAAGANYATRSGSTVTSDGKKGSAVTRGGFGTSSGGAKSSVGGSKSSGS